MCFLKKSLSNVFLKSANYRIKIEYAPDQKGRKKRLTGYFLGLQKV
jgi:hypothetical protein